MEYATNSGTQQLVQWADSTGAMQQLSMVPLAQQFQTQMPMFMPHQLMAYQQLAVQYTELMDANLAMKREYQEAQQKICNFELGMRGTDYELLEDHSAARLYLVKGSSREIFAEISIDTVQMIWLPIPNGEKFCAFSIYFKRRDGNGGSIDICEKELDSPKLLMQAFEKAGVRIMVSRSAAVKHALLRRLLLEKVGSNIVLLPYLSGWSDGVFRYVTMAGSQKLHLLGAEAPSLKRNFADVQMPLQDIREVVANSVEVFGENLAMLLFSVAIGAILYTPLSKAGFYPECLFAIDSRKKSAKEARKHLQIWETEMRISLSQGKYLEEKLCESKDEILFIVDEGSAYSLKMREKFLTILCDREVRNPANESIIELQTVPVLLSGCISEWGDFYERTLSLPLPDGIPKGQIDRRAVSSFYRAFVDWMNTNTAWLPEMISALGIQEYQGKAHSTYCWIMAANEIFCAYLQMCGVSNPVKLVYFKEYVQDWMSRAEYMSNLNLAERFREMLQMFKLQGGLRFAEFWQYMGTREESLSVYFDEDFIYLPVEVFKAIVGGVLPGYHYSEVYRELVEEGYAKGENSHVFPKVTLKHGGQRIRMAKLQRQFLLSDEEILLGVEYGSN